VPVQCFQPYGACNLLLDKDLRRSAHDAMEPSALSEGRLPAGGLDKSVHGEHAGVGAMRLA
jgi:hypothetical protein